MRRYILVAILVIFALNKVSAQRRMEMGLDSISGGSNVNLGSKLVLTPVSYPNLVVYDDINFNLYNYPSPGGDQLKFTGHHGKMVIYGASAYVILTNSAGTYLYRYSGGASFTRIIVPGDIVSNCEVRGLYLYIMLRVSGKVSLYQYNGSAFSLVSSTLMPATAMYKLKLSDNLLYLIAWGSGSTYLIKKYNGTTVSTIPHFEFYGGIENIYPVPGTGNIYFQVGSYKVVYYNGTTVTTVFDAAGAQMQCVIWNSDLYIISDDGFPPAANMYKVSGAVRTFASIPAGTAMIWIGNPVVYDGDLFFTVRYPSGRKVVIRYNGTSFSDFFLITEAMPSGVVLFVRDGKLMIQPNYYNAINAYEYDGAVFTEIQAPPDHVIFPYLGSTACTYIWLTYHTVFDPVSHIEHIRFAYSKEARCPPPVPPGPAPVIPSGIRLYDRYDFTAANEYYRECWSDIIIDWVIEPYCPLPPCPDPENQITMTDLANKIAWQKEVNQRGIFNVPLTEKTYTTFISASQNGIKDFIRIDADLPQSGFTELKFSTDAKNKSVTISASTKDNQALSLKASLINWNGKVIWEKTFMAPFTQTIQDQVQEWGQYMRFSLGGNSQKSIPPDVTISSIHSDSDDCNGKSKAEEKIGKLKKQE